MISLFNANDVLRVVTTSVANLDITGAYVTNSEPVAFGSIRQSISSATTTTIVSAPSAGQKRDVFSVTIRNRHASTANTVTVQIFDGANAFEIVKVTLAAGEQVEFDGLHGWSYLNAQGMPKTSQSQNSSGVAISAINLVTLASNVTNSNAVANTMQDVTGLSFPVVSGQTYQFEFFIPYSAAATTTGSRWSINGPTASYLALRSTYSLTTTSLTFNSVNGYDLPAASNATSATTTSNLAYMTGIITPSADGNVIARFASEVLSSAITAKAGALLKWTRTL